MIQGNFGGVLSNELIMFRFLKTTPIVIYLITKIICLLFLNENSGFPVWFEREMDKAHTFSELLFALSG